MSLIKKVNECASGGSVGAGAVAAVPAPLFGKGRALKRVLKGGSLFNGGIVNAKKSKKNAAKSRLHSLMMRVNEETSKREKVKPVNAPRDQYQIIRSFNEGSEQFDLSDVVSKLDAAEKKAHLDKDTVTFGLEDENGGVVRVYVRADQSKDFETTLAAMLAGEDDNEDDENTGTEIAEVLFKLKDRFDIVDVDWGSIEEDEEQGPDQQVAGAEGEGGEEGETPEMTADVQEPGAEEQVPGGEMGELGGLGGGEEEAKSALQQVIDMLKTDAEAKKAEAEAKAAEARAKEAEWNAKASEAKVKQEEQILDMESYYDDQSKIDKEAKQLAKLAKWKHDKAREAGEKLSGKASNAAEEEEQGGGRVPQFSRKPTVSPDELRDALFYYLRGR